MALLINYNDSPNKYTLSDAVADSVADTAYKITACTTGAQQDCNLKAASRINESRIRDWPQGHPERSALELHVLYTSGASLKRVE